MGREAAMAWCGRWVRGGNGGAGRKAVFKGRGGVLITRHGDNAAGIGLGGGLYWPSLLHPPPASRKNHARHRPPAARPGIRHRRHGRQGALPLTVQTTLTPRRRRSSSTRSPAPMPPPPTSLP